MVAPLTTLMPVCLCSELVPVILMDFLTNPQFAMMFASPAPTTVISPSEETVATLGFEES